MTEQQCKCLFCENCEGSDYCGCPAGIYCKSESPVETGTHTADHSLNGEGGSNPSDRDIDTLVGRIFTITLNWHEKHHPWDAEKVKACILGWHEYQNKLGEADHSRRAEMPPSSFIVSQGTSDRTMCTAEAMNLGGMYAATNKDAAVYREGVKQNLTPRQRELHAALDVFFDNEGSQEWFEQEIANYVVDKALGKLTQASPEPRPAPPPLEEKV
jgi:hypothetical protein